MVKSTAQQKEAPTDLAYRQGPHESTGGRLIDSGTSVDTILCTTGRDTTQALVLKSKRASPAGPSLS